MKRIGLDRYGIFFLLFLITLTTSINQEILAEEQKIPDWVKNIFVWYGQDQISEDDVLNAIKFLTENNVIRLEQKDQSESMMKNDMMNSDMSGSSMENMPFNVKTQLTLPMLNGYYNDKKVHFIHTEVSDSDVAQKMSMMTNFRTLHVPDLTNMSHEDMSIVYVFTNGVPGDGPYIGGPFGFQVDVFDSIPNQLGHTQFKMPYLVTWNANSEPRILTSVEDIMESEENGELSITKTELVVNMPLITWYDDDKKQKIEHIVSPYMTIPSYDAMIVNIDEENGLLSLKFHSSGTQIDMMN